MGRSFFLVGASLLVVACATENPPLLEEDGKYRAERERAPRDRWNILRGAPEQPAADTAYRASLEEFQTNAAEASSVLPPALVQSHGGHTVPGPDDVASVGATGARVAAPQAAPLQTPARSAPGSRFPELGPVPPKPSQSGELTSSRGPYFTGTSSTSAQGGASGNLNAPAVRGAAAPSAQDHLTQSQNRVVRGAVPRSASNTPQALNRPFDPSRAAPVPATKPRAAAADAPLPSANALELQRLAAQAVVARVNAFRAKHGYEPLAYSEELSRIARGHVTYLAQRGQVTSQNSNGQGIGVRLADAGYPARVAGSLVSGGYPTFEEALGQWSSNQVEASRLLHPSATELGFAVITDQTSTYRTYIEAIVASR